MKKLFILLLFLAFFFTFGAYVSDKNNPYSKDSWVTTFYTTNVDKNGQLQLYKSRNLYFLNTPFSGLLSSIQAFFRIEGNAWNPEKPFSGSIGQIITQVHKERFDVTKPYVISGGHFAEFYVRNFGIFYSAILDSRFALSQTDWEDRERVTLQTVATHLELLKQAGKEYTTFVPISPNVFVGANIYTSPSDSLFALFYTLAALKNPNFIQDNFPANIKPLYKLQTQDAASKLLAMYKQTLVQVTSQYLKDIIDPKTGIIKKDITLSSARDGIRRQSSFYDNVIAWSTARLVYELGVQITLPYSYCSGEELRIMNQESSKTKKMSLLDCNMEQWKQKIITTFWDEKTGIFIDDLSQDSIRNHIYSGDAFIVTSTKFLDFTNSLDRQKIEREIMYVQKNNMDKPFPLRYAIADQPEKLYPFVRCCSTSYMGESIWSHWGMEYIKTLILLSQDNPSYLATAQKELDAYTQNIKKYGGYPELYDKYGNIFQTPFYKSVLHTGWVVNYEEAKMLLDSK